MTELWPRNKVQPANGWTLDFEFLRKVKKLTLEWSVSEEEIESVLLAGEALIEPVRKLDIENPGRIAD
jgi:hypothetical protein